MSLYLVYFYALFSFVLIRFSFILFKYYFLFEIVYYKLHILYFRNEYMMEGVLEQKKGVWSWFGAKIRKIRNKNIKPPSQKLGTARANVGTAVPPPRTAFAAFAWRPSYPILVLPECPYSCFDFKSIVKL